jgi:hypothetical protein
LVALAQVRFVKSRPRPNSDEQICPQDGAAPVNVKSFLDEARGNRAVRRIVKILSSTFVRRSINIPCVSVAAVCAISATLPARAFAARETTRERVPHEDVEIPQKDAASSASEVTVDLDRQELTVRPVAAKAPAGKSDE